MSNSSKPKTPAVHRTLRRGALAGALAVTFTLGGCSTPTDSQEATAVEESAAGVAVAGVVKTSHGKYRQSTITSSDPAWKLPDEAISPEVLVEYTRQDLDDAYRFALKFTAEEGIDSPLNGEATSVEDWWNDHEDDFHPDNRDEMLTALEQNRAVVQREPWQTKDFEDYSYVYDSGPRVLERTITPDAVWIAGDGSIAVRMDVNYTMKVVPDIGTAGDGRQVTNGFMTYSVKKDSNGDWAITSFMHNLNTFPG